MEAEIKGAKKKLSGDELKKWKYQKYIKDYLRCIASVDDNVGRFLDFLDSSGLSTLVRISIQLAREGGVLRLVCGPGRVRDALTVTRLIEAIPTFESESAALQNFA